MEERLPNKHKPLILGPQLGGWGRGGERSWNKDSRLYTYLQGCRLGAQLGREDTGEQVH